MRKVRLSDEFQIPACALIVAGIARLRLRPSQSYLSRILVSAIAYPSPDVINFSIGLSRRELTSQNRKSGHIGG